jgi:hypothetical protein
LALNYAQSLPQYTKDYTKNSESLTPDFLYTAFKDVLNMNDELSALFVSVTWRESRWKVYTVQKKYGAFGLFQLSTVPKDGGLGSCRLIAPSEEKTTFWRLALPEIPKDQRLGEDEIREKIYEKTTLEGTDNGATTFDRRCWNIVNQMALFRSKIGQNDFKKQITDISVLDPWGDTYAGYGFLTHLKYSLAREVYEKMTGKSESDLQNWVLDAMNNKTRSKSNSNRLNTTDISNDTPGTKTYLQSWLEGYYFGVDGSIKRTGE